LSNSYRHNDTFLKESFRTVSSILKNLFEMFCYRVWQKVTITDLHISQSIAIRLSRVSVYLFPPYKGDIRFVSESSPGIEDANEMRERSSLGLFELYS
jgi:hypothetical protein